MIIVLQPFDKEGIPTKETDQLFWTIFDSPESKDYDDKVDHDKLRLELINHGIEASEAIVIIDYYVKFGAIAKHDLTNYVKTVLYKELQKTWNKMDNIRVQNHEESKKRFYHIPKEICTKAYAAVLLSPNGAWAETDDKGNIIRVLSESSYKKEMEINQ